MRELSLLVFKFKNQFHKLKTNVCYFPTRRPTLQFVTESFIMYSVFGLYKKNLRLFTFCDFLVKADAQKLRKSDGSKAENINPRFIIHLGLRLRNDCSGSNNHYPSELAYIGYEYGYPEFPQMEPTSFFTQSLGSSMSFVFSIGYAYQLQFSSDTATIRVANTLGCLF